MTFPIPIKQLLMINLTFRNVWTLGALPWLLMSIYSYPTLMGSTLTVEEFSTSQHPTSVTQNTRAFYFTCALRKKKKKISPIKLGLRKRKFKLSVSVTSWVLSHKSLGERSVSESSVSYLRMRSFVERQERERGRRRLGERGEEERSLGSPQSFGKSRQVALSSWEDSIINDASTRSHLGIPYSLGDLLHLILSRVWCGLPLKRDALHASCIMNDAKETLLS